MRVTRIAVVLVGALMCGNTVSAAEYEIDTRGAHAAINFKFKHLGISWLTGTFRKFSGTFSYDADSPAASTIVVDIDAASLDSNHAERDKHIRGEDYLDVGTYPTARFESTRVDVQGEGMAMVFGNLTLRGVTREIAIEATITGQGDDPWGGYRVGFQGFVTLHTPDFGFKLPPSNEVDMELYIEGRRQ